MPSLQALLLYVNQCVDRRQWEALSSAFMFPGEPGFDELERELYAMSASQLHRPRTTLRL